MINNSMTAHNFAHNVKENLCSRSMFWVYTQPYEYAALLEELKQVGYVGEYALNVVKRLNLRKVFKLR